MGKRQREDLTNCFKESVDPRFCGIFSSNSNKKACTDAHATVKVPEDRCQKDDLGLQNFIYAAVSEYFDKHVKEVDRPVVQDDFFNCALESMSLFSDSDIITLQEAVKSVQVKQKKKCKKEKSERESFKEVAVTFDWIQRQSHILNS